MEDRDWAVFWLVVIGIVALTIMALVLNNDYQYRAMADKGFCWVPSDSVNTLVNTWSKCK